MIVGKKKSCTLIGKVENRIIKLKKMKIPKSVTRRKHSFYACQYVFIRCYIYVYVIKGFRVWIPFYKLCLNL